MGPLVCDGAMSTMLYSNLGVSLDRPTEELCLTNPDQVRDVHLSYIRSGAQIIETNTFAANKEKLSAYGLEKRVQDINRAATQIAVESRQFTNQHIWIAGTVGPLGKQISPIGTLSVKRARNIFQEQVEELATSGVNIIILETFSDLGEIEVASEAAASTGLPFIAQMAFGQDGLTSFGYTPSEVAVRIEAMGATVIGANCSVGSAPMVATISEMKRRTSTPISAQPNAGFPTLLQGRMIYRSTPEYMATQAIRLIEQGATIIGGCCGTTPTHTAKIRDSIPKISTLDRQPHHPTLVKNIGHREPLQPNDLEPSELPKKFEEGKLVITMEVSPPRGFEASEILSRLEHIGSSGVVDALNVADNPRAQGRMSALAMSALIHEHLAIETILHVALRHRNYLALHSDLMGAHALGIRNVFAVMGDRPQSGNYPSSYSFSDLTTTGALHLMSSFNSGSALDDTHGHNSTNFFKGAAFNPSASNIDKEFKLLERKLEAGADFLLTQPVYDPEPIAQIAQKIGGFPVPILIGILPLRSKENASFLQNEVPGISIPKHVLDSISSSNQPRLTGMEISRNTTRDLAGTVSGIYYMAPFGRYETVIDFVKNLNLE